MKYGWRLDNIKEKRNRSINGKSAEDKITSFVYEEMLADFHGENRESSSNINSYQFRRAINHFQPATYREEIDAILYFGSQLQQLELSIPTPTLSKSGEMETMTLAKTYMRRQEPNDFNYFRKIVNKEERIQFHYLASPNIFLGKSYFLSQDEYYILVNCVNSIQDAVTLLHETSHIETYLKYGLNLSAYFAELPSMTREHYSFDIFRNYDIEEEVEKQRALSLNHYLEKAMRLYHGLNLLMNLKQKSTSLRNAMNDFEKFSSLFDVEYLYDLLENSLEEELGYALSFIASLDIYMHCPPRQANLFITSYQIGTRKVSVKSIDRVATYLLETLNPYQKIKSI